MSAHVVLLLGTDLDRSGKLVQIGQSVPEPPASDAEGNWMVAELINGPAEYALNAVNQGVTSLGIKGTVKKACITYKGGIDR